MELFAQFVHLLSYFDYKMIEFYKKKLNLSDLRPDKFYDKFSKLFY